MRELLKGWKRKVGCVTLLIACGFAGLWIRGQAVKDVYQFGNGHGSFYDTVVSSRHGLMWFRYEATDGTGYSWNPGWFAIPINASTELYSEECKIVHEIKWHWSGWGFNFCDPGKEGRINVVHRNIPYWSIVIPLTALSAFLLLSKPCKSTEMKKPEPTANYGV